MLFQGIFPLSKISSLIFPLAEAVYPASFSLSNYRTINLHRQNGRAGGGVCIFIHESIDFKERKDLSIYRNYQQNRKYYS